MKVDIQFAGATVSVELSSNTFCIQEAFFRSLEDALVAAGPKTRALAPEFVAALEAQRASARALRQKLVDAEEQCPVSSLAIIKEDDWPDEDSVELLNESDPPFAFESSQCYNSEVEEGCEQSKSSVVSVKEHPRISEEATPSVVAPQAIEEEDSESDTSDENPPDRSVPLRSKDLKQAAAEAREEVTVKPKTPLQRLFSRAPWQRTKATSTSSASKSERTKFSSVVPEDISEKGSLLEIRSC